MKRVVVLGIMLFIIQWCWGTIKIDFKGTNKDTSISSKRVGNTDYVSLKEISRVFKSFVSEEIADDRIYLSIYGEQVILMTNSSYLSCQNQIQDMGAPLIALENVIYVPEIFLTKLLPSLVPGKMTYKATTNSLLIEAPEDNSIRTIVLDPGHGGKDAGAIGPTRTNEKDITLQLVQKLKSKLEDDLGVRVLLTRSTDDFVSLQQRTKFANDNKADLFISIHCNASVSRAADGIEVYYLSTARTTEARAVEALENDVVAKYEGGQSATQKYTDLSLILSDMMQYEILEESSNLAAKLQTNLVNSTLALDRGVKQAGFYVLRGNFMPSVLIETGFISNYTEEKKLSDPLYQDLIINAIFHGVKSFKYQYDRVRNS